MALSNIVNSSIKTLDLGGGSTAASSGALKPVVRSGSTGGGSTAPSGGSQVIVPKGPPNATQNTGSISSGLRNMALPQTSQPSASMDFNPDQYKTDQESAERARMEERNNQIRSGIHSAYQPIYDELDRQLGAVPTQQGELEGQLGSLATQQADSVNSSKSRELTGLDQNADDEKTRSKSTLRDIEQNVRNLLQGAQMYLGSVGAGDSSAVTEAAGQIGSVAAKTRGDALNVTNQALTQINRQKSNVESIATDNLKKIEDWKSNKLFEVKQWATDQLNKLSQAKAQAQGAEATAIQQLIDGTQQEFINRMRQLDDSVFQYKSSVSQWMQQRQANLEDQLTLMSESGKYTSNTPQDYKVITDAFGRTMYYNPKDPTGDSGLLMGSPSFGAGGEEDKKKTSSGFLGGLFDSAQNELNTDFMN